MAGIRPGGRRFCQRSRVACQIGQFGFFGGGGAGIIEWKISPEFSLIPIPQPPFPVVVNLVRVDRTVKVGTLCTAADLDYLARTR